MKYQVKRALVLLLGILLCGGCLGVAAAAQSPTADSARQPLSLALDVLAAQNDMAVATLCGNEYYFSEDVFARTLNLAHVGAITVCSLPAVTAGELLMGSERVSVGQRIKGSELQLLSFVAADEQVLGAAFTFSPEEGGYAMVCNIHVLDQVNASPTVSMTSEQARSVSTHRDFVGYGQLHAYDPEGDELVFEIVNAPEHGLVVMTDRARGEYVYLPREGFVGEDRFCYVARDVYGNYSSMAQIDVKVVAPATQIVYADMSGRWEHNAALSMTEAGIMQGKQQDSGWYFEPDMPVSRGEFLVMAMKAMGVGSVPQVQQSGFCDDELMDEEMRNYVAAAKALGYVQGNADAAGNLYFAPTASITRAEAAVILNRMLGSGQNIPVTAPVFADGEDIPAWASEAITSLTYQGILRSLGGAISPNATVSRADAACMLCAVLQSR